MASPRDYVTVYVHCQVCRKELWAHTGERAEMESLVPERCNACKRAEWTAQRIASLLRDRFVPRCDACDWWSKDAVETGGICRRQKAKSARLFAMPTQGASHADVITEADFGCIQWEPKACG